MFNKKYSVTQSKYWKYKNDNNNFNLIIFFKEIIENTFDIKIVKKKNFNNSFENTSYPKSKKIINMRNKELSIIILKFLSNLKVKSNKNKILKLIKLHDNFFYGQKKLKNNYGGIGYNNSLFIYIFYNHLKLNLILESGVWKGFTTLLFEQYPKKIKKISFDINFENLQYQSQKTEYVEYDIEKYNKNVSENKDSFGQIKTAENDDDVCGFDQQNRMNWFMPTEYKNLDIENYILNLAKTDQERERVKYELDLFKTYAMLDVLVFLKYLIELKKLKILLTINYME